MTPYESTDKPAAAPAGAATPDSVMAKEREAVDAKVAAAVGAPPENKKVVDIANVQALVDALDAVKDAISDGTDVHIVYQPADRSKSVRAPLPLEVWRPLKLMGMGLPALAARPGGEVLAPYAFDPEAAADGTKMADTGALLLRLSMDKKAIEFLKQQAQAMAEQGPGEEAMEPDEDTAEEGMEPPASTMPTDTANP